jgi:hypothetical protein
LNDLKLKDYEINDKAEELKEAEINSANKKKV